MGVYDLENPADLEFDLNNILNRLNELFIIKFTEEQINVTPKWIDNSEAFWASEENTQVFNKHIPSFKSLHKDMYAFIESYYKHTAGKYEYSTLESKYQDYREFRHLNNMFKHPKKKEVAISFTKLVLINSKQFELMCNFKYPDSFKCLNYSSFIILFLTILRDLKILKTQELGT